MLMDMVVVWVVVGVCNVRACVSVRALLCCALYRHLLLCHPYHTIITPYPTLPLPHQSRLLASTPSSNYYCISLLSLPSLLPNFVTNWQDWFSKAVEGADPTDRQQLATLSLAKSSHQSPRAPILPQSLACRFWGASFQRNVRTLAKSLSRSFND